MTFWSENLHRTLFLCRYTYNCHTGSLVCRQEGRLINRKWAPQKSYSSSYNVFSTEATDSMWLCVCESRLNATEKGNSLLEQSVETGCFLVIVPLVTEARWKGQHIVQTFQGGTGQREKVQLYGWLSGEEEGCLMEPVSHEVLIVLGVTTVELCIVKVVSHLCFQTATRYDSFLLLLAFVLLLQWQKQDMN